MEAPGVESHQMCGHFYLNHADIRDTSNEWNPIKERPAAHEIWLVVEAVNLWKTGLKAKPPAMKPFFMGWRNPHASALNR
eukprot:5024098-Pyramimonas_sp.AAC.1